jgi:hypothetical protein
MSQANATNNAPSDFRSIENNFVGHFGSNYSFFYTNFGNLQLDIVGFLAVLGEGSVLANAQVSTLSRLIYLPRLIPAPQALLRPTRPSKLHPESGTVSGIYSGNKRDYVNYIGHLVLDAEKMPAFSVRCVQIERVKEDKTVEATTFGPQSWLAVFGCLEAVVLLIFAILYRDGMAIFAVFLLSALSTLVGIGNKWKLRLHKRTVSNSKHVPKGDVVIRYPKGNFLIVQCTEEVARELYFAPEDIDYMITHPPIYRLISLVGTMMIMFGVISLANSQIQLQMAFAASYILLNAAYWVVAAIPSKMHWDKSCFNIQKQKFQKTDDGKCHPKTFTDFNQTFTWALWKAIIATKQIGWIRWSNATPHSRAWDQWLRIALEKAQTASFTCEDGVKVWEVPEWDPQACLSELLADPDYADVASTREIEVQDAVNGSDKV